MYRTPVASPSKAGRRFSQDSPSPSPKRDEQQEASKLFINRTQVKRRSLEIKKRYDTKSKIGMMNENTQELLKQVMLLFEETAETVYGQMRRDVKAKLEEIADKGLTTMFEISRRWTGQGEERREEKEGGIEIQLKEMREEMRRNMEEWRNKKEQEEEKRQEVEEIIISTREEMRGITKKIETSEDNIVAEVIDLGRKRKETKVTCGKIEGEEDKQREVEVEEISKKELKEIKEEINDTKQDIRHELMCIQGDLVEIRNEIYKRFDKTTESLVLAETNIGIVIENQVTAQESLNINEDLLNEMKGKIGDREEQTAHQNNNIMNGTTYANITKRHIPETIHSIVLQSENKNDTAEDLIQKTNKILDPKTGDIKIDKIRKIKDQKIIIGCKQEKEINKIKEKLENSKGISVEKIENKNPLILIKEVQYRMQDEELIQLIINQNKEYFKKEEDKEIKIKFKKKAINQERSHAVMQVKPDVWRAMTEAGRVYIGMERLKVEDQSPLIQCTKCLGFGHGKKFCQESASRCSHCGDPHLRANCPERKAGRPPRCCNCTHAGIENEEHNAFSKECRVREKWEYLARTTTAYV
ncbi:unnamed protein product [Diatraea saccharalis]|uniref:Uncharacterized protein n=1 Tax=Diatraea saccharalis TaxID=40085 RepID=A0A9N9QUK4_9NEOP|nr:unnamed protein product [Diatraea saccharalis]